MAEHWRESAEELFRCAEAAFVACLEVGILELNISEESWLVSLL
jgi:hypothetical protein